MQFNCYKRNYHSSVCVNKCQFRKECDLQYCKDVKLKSRWYTDDEIETMKKKFKFV